MKTLTYHKTNGAVVEVETDDKTGRELSRNIIIRLVYADSDLADKIVELIKKERNLS